MAIIISALQNLLPGTRDSTRNFLKIGGFVFYYQNKTLGTQYALFLNDFNLDFTSDKI